MGRWVKLGKGLLFNQWIFSELSFTLSNASNMLLRLKCCGCIGTWVEDIWSGALGVGDVRLSLLTWGRASNPDFGRKVLSVGESQGTWTESTLLIPIFIIFEPRAGCDNTLKLLSFSSVDFSSYIFSLISETIWCLMFFYISYSNIPISNRVIEL